jgi:hypothetical protein
MVFAKQFGIKLQYNKKVQNDQKRVTLYPFNHCKHLILYDLHELNSFALTVINEVRKPDVYPPTTHFATDHRRREYGI